MPTRPGWTTLVAAGLAAAIGRLFGVTELFVLAAGMGLAVLLAVVVVQVRRPRLRIDRWIHPTLVTVGDEGRVDLDIANTGLLRSPRATLVEPVGQHATARLDITPLRRGDHSPAAYRVPAERRGVLRVGPLRVTRRDVLGLAVTDHIVTGETEIVIAPRTIEITMPELGHGVLGRHLLSQAVRLGAGEFHGLRDYVPGDELRSVHWRASARSEELKVRQHTTEGVRRCIVVLDREFTDDDAFERAVVAAASVVTASDRVGLTTRFVTSGEVDLRGPDVASLTLRVLAPIGPNGPIDHVDRDPGDGLGLLVVVTSGPASTTWRRTEQLLDPALSRVGVFTSTKEGGRLAVSASSVEDFARGWDALAGRRSSAPATRSAPSAAVTAGGAPWRAASG